MLSAGQFFAVLRLVIHVQAGAAVDRNMVFVQGELLFYQRSLSVRGTDESRGRR